MLTLCSAHKMKNNLDVLLKYPVALKILACQSPLEQGAARRPPDPHYFFFFPGGGDSWLFGPMCLLFLSKDY